MKKHKIFKNKKQLAAFIAFNILFAMVFFEVLLRVADYQTEVIDYTLYFGNTPSNETGIFFRQDLNFTSVSRDQFNADDVIEGKITYFPEEVWAPICRSNKTKQRILFFGDSVTEGRITPEGNRALPIDMFLSQLLNKSNASYDVLNFAIGGYQPAQIYGALKKNALCEPDIIVFGLCYNDLKDNGLPFAMLEEFAPKFRDSLEYIRQHPVIYSLLQKSYAARFAFDRYIAVRSLFAPYDYDFYAYTSEETNRINAMNYLYFNRTIRAISEMNRPAILLVYPRVDTDSNNTYGFYYDLVQDDESIIAYLESYHADSIRIIDLKKEFALRKVDPKKVMYSGSDPIHFNDLGNSIIAEILYENLNESNLV